MVKFSIGPRYTLFYWAYAIVWCEVECWVLSLIYDEWIFTIYNIRLGPFSTPNIRQNLRSHLWEIRVACPIEIQEEHGEEDLLGPGAKCARTWLLLFVIYLGLFKVSGGTSLILMDLSIICVLVASMYMPLILTSETDHMGWWGKEYMGTHSKNHPPLPMGPYIWLLHTLIIK